MVSADAVHTPQRERFAVQLTGMLVPAVSSLNIND